MPARTQKCTPGAHHTVRWYIVYQDGGELKETVVTVNVHQPDAMFPQDWVRRFIPANADWTGAIL